ncbi:hypothetical protein K2X30_05225 [bacterium]|nr:hypothetical protein [bacterium]
MPLFRGAVLISFMLAIFSAPAFSDNPDILMLKQRLQGPVSGAHQGGLSSTRMNTLPNFESARKAGVTVVEMDLRISKDGIPVVFHDEKLRPWTVCYGPVRNKTVEQLQRDCPFNHGAIISSFEEILRWAQGRVVVNAEFKDEETIVPAIQVVQKYAAYSWVYFQTQGSWQKYKLARDTDSEVALLFSPKNEPDFFLAVNNTDPNLIIIEVDKRWDNPNYIDAIHASGRLASVDSFDYDFTKELFAASCSEAFKRKIDIAISNRPESCQKQATSARRPLMRTLASQ